MQMRQPGRPASHIDTVVAGGRRKLRRRVAGCRFPGRFGREPESEHQVQPGPDRPRFLSIHADESAEGLRRDWVIEREELKWSSVVESELVVPGWLVRALFVEARVDEVESGFELVAAGEQV